MTEWRGLVYTCGAMRCSEIIEPEVVEWLETLQFAEGGGGGRGESYSPASGPGGIGEDPAS